MAVQEEHLNTMKAENETGRAYARSEIGGFE